MFCGLFCLYPSNYLNHPHHPYLFHVACKTTNDLRLDVSPNWAQIWSEFYWKLGRYPWLCVLVLSDGTYWVPTSSLLRRLLALNTHSQVISYEFAKIRFTFYFLCYTIIWLWSIYALMQFWIFFRSNRCEIRGKYCSNFSFIRWKN